MRVYVSEISPECRECKFCKSGKTNLCGSGQRPFHFSNDVILTYVSLAQSVLPRAKV